MSEPASRTLLTREELYEKVWTKPVRTVAAELGISNVGLAKICTRLDVPRPGPSYWGRIRHGQKPDRAPLPPRRDDVPERVEIRGQRTGETPSEPTLAVPVPASLDAPHAAVRALQKALRGAKPNGEGLVFVLGKDEYVLRVSPSALGRALLIYDGLFKALEARGHQIALGEVKEPHLMRRPLDVIVDGKRVALSLAERLRQSEHVLTVQELADKARSSFSFAPKYDFAPSGKLTLFVGGRYGLGHHAVSDGKSQKLEERLGEIVIGIERASREIAENDRRNEEYRQRSELAERLRYKEQALRKDLDEMVARWTEATQIRAFLAAVGQGVPDELRSQAGFAAWLSWATARAEALDPLTSPAQIAKLVDADCSAAADAELNLKSPIKADCVATRSAPNSGGRRARRRR